MAISKLDVTFHASTTDYGSKKESTQDVVEGGSETDASEEKPVFEASLFGFRPRPPCSRQLEV